MRVGVFESGDTVEFPNGARAVLLERSFARDCWDCRWQRHEIASLVGAEFELDPDVLENGSVRVIESERARIA